MSQINVIIRMDENIMQEFDRLCMELGLNMTTAINVFARISVRQHRIPFEIALEVPNDETIEAIYEVRQAKRNPDKKLYSNFSELLKEVEADV